MIVTNDYSGYVVMIFENGKAAKVPLNAYETKTGMILPKSARDTIGVQVVSLKAKAVVNAARVITEENADQYAKYYVKTIPAAGSLAKDLADIDQLTF